MSWYGPADPYNKLTKTVELMVIIDKWINDKSTEIIKKVAQETNLVSEWWRE